MAIYHLCIKIISRGKGKSAVAASAYRSGEKIKNEYDGIVHDFTRKGGIAHTEILLPQNAPQEFVNRSILWNSVEKIEKSKNSQLAREIEVALPKELDREKQINLVREYVKENFVKVGMCADIALHDKNDGNPHCHILLTMRPLNEDTTWGAKSKKEYILDENGEKVKLKNGNYKTRKINTTDWNEQDKAEEWRKAWADITNKYLEENSIQDKVDHRSYQRQGIEQIPTIHLGVSATQMEKRGIATDRGNINREIKHQNMILREISRRIKALLNWIRGIGKEEKREHENTKSTLPPKENLLSVLENLIRKNTDKNNTDLEKYIGSYQLLKEKNITSINQLKESITNLRDKNYKTTRALKDTEKKIDEKTQLIDQSEKYLKYKDTYKAYIKTKKSKQEDFYNEHTAELILFESAKKHLKEHLGESKTLAISKWKSEVSTLKKEKKSLYSQILEIREEVEQAEKVKTCIEQLEGHEKRLSQVKRNELDL
ncbi:MobA/MobL family protein [Peptostreptococcus anaerobius]|uniref:MobQ family relaxase n=1 Tax=Bacteria TaxID=2 RepID=UPI001D087AEA|nr:MULTISPECIES: MobQ family relaxase [Bacteria]MCB6983705.1 MobA/MobL family protein [Peptostreptococcus anaerobius]MCQ5151578.1 MobA/MobL family protein [Peptostreptococcus anaerobius]HEN9466836.1 MobA/MobL family protein [Streptococcus agalactiae]HEO4577465.1 MobA/MobL family protein [Streptococcus agalactiae]